MPLELSTPWVITLNVAGWPVIHLAVAWLFTLLPDLVFARGRTPGGWEATVYARVLKVRVWKDLLPDAAPWLRGFPKQRLLSNDPEYLRRFIRETRRGEAAHWAMLLCGALFFLWNPPSADAVMAGYALTANLPCIVVQRYNRIRFERLLRHHSPQLHGSLG